MWELYHNLRGGARGCPFAEAGLPSRQTASTRCVTARPKSTKHMKQTLSIFALVLGLFVAAFAQASERHSSDGDGYSFAAVKGWTNTASGDGFVIVNPAKTIVIAVKGHSYKDFASFAADANLERDGLELVGKPQEVRGGQIFRTVKRSPQGTAVIDTAVVFKSSGGGVVVAAITDEANAVTGFNTAVAIANSIEFFQPKVSATAEKVRSVLAGKRLLYLYTGNGYSERKDVVLCSNGVFYQSLDMGGFSAGNVDGPSFAAIGGKRGRWSVSADGSKLLMAFDTVGTVQYTLSARQASNEIGMNGQRWFVQSQTVCS